MQTKSRYAGDPYEYEYLAALAAIVWVLSIEKEEKMTF